MKSNSLVVCTCGGLQLNYPDTCNEIEFTGSIEPLLIDFIIPRTMLMHDHLRPLSCQRLKPPTTFTK